ncbi:MAG: DUF547 domain-containing protein [Candidatus Heimdallarchaeota archaeon]|nr:MAG: DUF547 domain-containing protein [Candidatus Heimdallarchaeota archaeon]
MSSTTPFDHLSALKPYIDSNGLVNYEKLKKDEWLIDQVQHLKTADLHNMNQNEEFAFWLNAYNILTIKGVYIELERNPNWKGNLSLFNKIRFFFLRRFNVAGKKINLRNLENKILRKRFKDPRIHFAINCASKSCPNLPKRLFDPETLDKFLDSLTLSFINDKDHVFLDTEKDILYLNPIFKWYTKDFEIQGGVKGFILKYLQDAEKSIIETYKKARIKYIKYDWSINAQEPPENLLKIDILSKN